MVSNCYHMLNSARRERLNKRSHLTCNDGKWIYSHTTLHQIANHSGPFYLIVHTIISLLTFCAFSTQPGHVSTVWSASHVKGAHLSKLKYLARLFPCESLWKEGVPHVRSGWQMHNAINCKWKLTPQSARSVISSFTINLGVDSYTTNMINDANILLLYRFESPRLWSERWQWTQSTCVSAALHGPITIGQAWQDGSCHQYNVRKSSYC